MDAKIAQSRVDMLYEDSELIAVNKPEGISSISEPGGGLPELVKVFFSGKIYPVHRLDKEASGVIVYAKNPDVHRMLNISFEQHVIHKTYLVALHGSLKTKKGTIDKPIRKFGSGRMGVDSSYGKPSRTRYEVIQKFSRASLARAFPVTGRRHQIRVHFYSIGHPVIGDLKYGDKSIQRRYPRLMLHAFSLSIPLPSGEMITIEAPPPESFNKVLEELAG